MADAGQLITFYSYKGGTGRTMALANVACVLAERDDCKRGVLVVDWDVEAPGLHRYFPDTRDAQDTVDGEGTKGLIERLEGRSVDLDWKSETAETGVDDVYLLPAGRLDAGYGIRAEEVPWRRLDKEGVFTRLAEAWTAQFDYVLIDSRTGVGDTSHICTAVLPDKIALFFTPNQQSIGGVEGVIRMAASKRRRDDKEPPVVFPVVSRYDPSVEGFHEWRQEYQSRFERLFKDVYRLQECDLKSYFESIGILHEPRGLHGEQLFVRDTEGLPSPISSSYRYLAECLVDSNPWEEGSVARRVTDLRRSRLWLPEERLVESVQVWNEWKREQLSPPSIDRKALLPDVLDGVDFSGCDLSGVNLVGKSLQFANLDGTDFTDARLDGAKLTGARAAGAVFRNAKMRGAALDSAVFEDCNFEAADLTGASFELSRLSGGSLSGARLVRAYLNSAVLTDVDLSGASIREATLYKASLAGVSLRGCECGWTNFGAMRFGQIDGLGDLEHRGPSVLDREAVASLLVSECEGLETFMAECGYPDWSPTASDLSLVFIVHSPRDEECARRLKGALGRPPIWLEPHARGESSDGPGSELRLTDVVIALVSEAAREGHWLDGEVLRALEAEKIWEGTPTPRIHLVDLDGSAGALVANSPALQGRTIHDLSDAALTQSVAEALRTALEMSGDEAQASPSAP